MRKVGLNDMGAANWNIIETELKKPFGQDSLSVRVGSMTRDKSKCIALPYIDARDVMERLDDIVGTENWSDSYTVVSNNAVVCSLTIFGVTKSDAGQSKDDGSGGEAKDLKSAFSDAFKRAAVKFGIGQFLYGLPKQWENLDSHKRFVRDSQVIVSDILRKGGMKTSKAPTPKPAPKPKPVSKSVVPATPTPRKETPVKKATATPATTSAFTEQQIKDIKELKSKLHIRENDQLNPFIEDWSGKKLHSVKDLNGGNIDDFMKFLKEKYLGEAVASK